VVNHSLPKEKTVPTVLKTVEHAPQKNVVQPKNALTATNRKQSEREGYATPATGNGSEHIKKQNMNALAKSAAAPFSAEIKIPQSAPANAPQILP